MPEEQPIDVWGRLSAEAKDAISKALRQDGYRLSTEGSKLLDYLAERNLSAPRGGVRQGSAGHQLTGYGVLVAKAGESPEE